jgi:hypothetical protein
MTLDELRDKVAGLRDRTHKELHRRPWPRNMDDIEEEATLLGKIEAFAQVLALIDPGSGLGGQGQAKGARVPAVAVS